MFCVFLVTFTLFSGCVEESNSGKHAVTLHFKDVKGNPITGVGVQTFGNYNTTNSEGNVIFTMEGDFPYNINVFYQGDMITYYKVYPTKKYYEYTLENSRFTKCNIELLDSTHNYDGLWTSIYGIANNTGASGYCAVTADLFEGNMQTSDYNKTPIDSKTEKIYIAGGEKQAFVFNNSVPIDALKNHYSVSIKGV
jgi:hypothetical protein